MNEWGVVGVIITLISGFGLVVKPVIGLTQAITTLTNKIEHIDGKVLEYSQRNAAKHKELWDYQEKQNETIEDHEKRITKIETKIGSRNEED